MGRVAYVNRRFVPHCQAFVHIEDRGYQFADGAYEVFAVQGGVLRDKVGHISRLERSLGELSIRMPMSSEALFIVIDELLRKNRYRDALIYLQVTRGVASRDHFFSDGMIPSLVMTVRPVNYDVVGERAKVGVNVWTVPDERWARCDIKTTGLLPNVLAKQKARQNGAVEAWFVDHEGFVTEGASSNAWIVTNTGTLVTRKLSTSILPGVTRQSILSLAVARNLSVEERAFSVGEAKVAEEAFLTSAGMFVMPVVKIDDTMIKKGCPGEISQSLRAGYIDNPLN